MSKPTTFIRGAFELKALCQHIVDRKVLKITCCTSKQKPCKSNVPLALSTSRKPFSKAMLDLASMPLRLPMYNPCCSSKFCSVAAALQGDHSVVVCVI